MNIVTDPAQLERKGSITRVGFRFSKTTLSYNGLINDRFALSGSVVKRQAMVTTREHGLMRALII